MPATMADLLAAAAAEDTVEKSLVTLLGTLAAQLKVAVANNDPAAIQSVLNSMQAQTADMAAAVVSNTPAANVPPAPIVASPADAPIQAAPGGENIVTQ